MSNRGLIIQLAASQIGTKEIAGSIHNKAIVDYAQEAGIEWIKDDETAWCSTFINWVAHKLGLPKSGSAAARSWEKVGKGVTFPTPGDIVIFWRKFPNSGYGHVGIYMGHTNDGNSVFVLGGNQNNEVNITPLPKNRIVDFRSLVDEKSVKGIEVGMMRGDQGDRVETLQRFLKDGGYNPGLVDGDFGEKTEKAVKRLQAKYGLHETGEINPATFNAIFTEQNG